MGKRKEKIINNYFPIYCTLYCKILRLPRIYKCYHVYRI